MKRYVKYALFVGLVIGLGLFGGDVVAATKLTIGKESLFSPHTLINLPVSNYELDPHGWFASFSPLLQIANLLFFLAVLFMRFAVKLMEIGFSEDDLKGIVSTVADVLHKHNSFPTQIFVLGAMAAAFMIVFDLIKKQYNILFSRLIKMIAVMLVFAVYAALPTSVFTAILQANDSISMQLANAEVSMSVMNTKDMSSASQTFDQTVWDKMVIFPFDQAEMGGDVTIKSSDLSSVKAKDGFDSSLLTNPAYWHQALLQYPVGSDERNDMVSTLYDYKTPDGTPVKNAFSDTNRLGIAFVTFLASGGPIVLLGAFGGLTFFFKLQFLFAVLAALVVLPLEFFPVTRTNKLFMGWIKLILGSLVAEIGLATYLGFVMFVVSFINSVLSFGGWPYLAIFVNGLWYYLAIFLFWKLIKKYNVIASFNQYVDGKFAGKGSKEKGNKGAAQQKSAVSPLLKSSFLKKKDQKAQSKPHGFNGNSSGVGSQWLNETPTSQKQPSKRTHIPKSAANFIKDSDPITPQGDGSSPSFLERVDQLAEKRHEQTAEAIKRKKDAVKDAISQTPGRLKNLPRQAAAQVKSFPRKFTVQAGRSLRKMGSQVRQMESPKEYIKRSWQGDNTLLGKAIADAKLLGMEIKNSKDPHTLSRYVLGVAESVTTGLAKKGLKAMVSVPPKLAYHTAKTGLKTTGIAGATAWVGMRKGQRFAERKSLEVAVKSRVKLHELSRQRQINKEAKRFIKGIDDWDMVAFHGKDHISTVDPGVQFDSSGSDSPRQVELSQPVMTKERSTPTLQPTAPVKYEPNRRKIKPEIQEANKARVTKPTVSFPMQKLRIKRPLDDITPSTKQTEIQDQIQTENKKPVPMKPPIPVITKEVEIPASQHSDSKVSLDSKPSTNEAVHAQTFRTSSHFKPPILRKQGTINKLVSTKIKDGQTRESKNRPQTPTIRRRKK